MKKVIIVSLCVFSCFESYIFGMRSPKPLISSPFTPQTDYRMEDHSDFELSDDSSPLEPWENPFFSRRKDEDLQQAEERANQAVLETVEIARQSFPIVICNQREIMGLLCDIEGVTPTARQQNFYTTVSRCLEEEEVPQDAPAFVFDLPFFDEQTSDK